MNHIFSFGFGAALIAGLAFPSADAEAQSPNILQAILVEPDQKTPEVSTEQLRSILKDQSATVIDSRPRKEFVGGHIPGAHNLDVAPEDYPDAALKLLNGDNGRPVILYCNGPFCQASRRLADRLSAAGFTDVRRYQLGMPVWRALGGPTEIELEGISRIFDVDRTAVFLDARSADEFAKGTIPGAKSLPADKMAAGEIKNPPFPMDDFNTRIIIFGSDGAQARQLADVLSKRPWHNVTYYTGGYSELDAGLPDRL